MLEIAQADPQDLPSILSLMDEYELPQEGIAEHLAATLVIREGAKVVGNVTLELYGRYCLLRSVAVTQALRGGGLGRRLIRAALDLAEKNGIREVYLLTDTARDFFERSFGFAPVEREAVPAEVKVSVEFVSACPVSSLVMMRSLAE